MAIYILEPRADLMQIVFSGGFTVVLLLQSVNYYVFTLDKLTQV